MTPYDVAIVGGGCVGCSIGDSLVENSDLDVCIVEKERSLAAHQSGRNSGVLHPGFNYPPGSTKARFSTEGTRRMKEYAAENGIPIDETGVLVVARTDAEEERLERLREQAVESGVDVSILRGEEAITEHEPHAMGQAALHCPEAASIDSRKYVYALATEAENDGVDFYMGYEVQDVDRTGDAFALRTSKGTLHAEYLVNAAGLYADRIAHRLGVGEGYQIVPFRGEYYELVPRKRGLVRSMIYPTPDPDLPFLGVHYTRRSDGKVIVGPNAVLAFGREAYANTEFDLGELARTLTHPGFVRLMASGKMLGLAWEEFKKSYRKEKFVAAARRLVPEVREEDFRESYAGIRAQLVSADGSLVKDPMVEHDERSTHVLNAVSPGLTSSLPFGEHVAEEVLRNVDR